MVEVSGISFAYKPSAGNILEDISFDMEQSRCIAILGNNGAGKSTLIKCIDRICKPQKGTVLVDGRNVVCMTDNEVARNIAYVPQNSKAINMTVFDAILLGRKPYIKWDATTEDRRIVCRIMDEMHLNAYALRNVSELSGGEVQKVMLARALAQEPGLLLLDEPTSNLDPRNQHEVLQTVKRIAAGHDTCVAIIIHDLNLAARYCDRFVLLKENRLFDYGGAEVLTPENIEAVYGMHVHITEYMGVPLIVPFPQEDVKLFETQAISAAAGRG